MQDSVQRLIANGHRLQDIEHYTIDQFLTFLDAVERSDAVSRLGNVIDLGAVVGGMFDQAPLKDHIDSLRQIATGE